MEQVFKVLEQISSTSSRNAKKKILLDNKDNELLKKFFLYAYNERWIFGIGEKSIRRRETSIKVNTSTNKVSQIPLFGVSSGRMSSFSNIFDLLDELIKHPYGSNADVLTVNTFLANCTEDAYYWYRRLILKDLKIGCTVTTVNEVYDDYIPDFKVMLAHPYEDHKKKVSGEFQLQEKINGFRLITYHHPDGSVEFFTRKGVQLYNFPDLERVFKEEIEPCRDTTVYDGEAQFGGTFNETQKYMMRDGAKTGVVYNVFDCVSIDEWERKDSDSNLFDRYDMLKLLLPGNYTWVQIVPELYRGSDVTQVTYWFNYATQHGWEGVMLKLNAPYVRKRTDTMLKIKQMHEIDLVCIRVNQGEQDGKNANTLGSITVDYNGVEVNVGGGYSDYERNDYWTNPDKIVGKIVTVQYLAETVNERNQPSLQSPQFLGVRLDK